MLRDSLSLIIASRCEAGVTILPDQVLVNPQDPRPQNSRLAAFEAECEAFLRRTQWPVDKITHLLEWSSRHSVFGRVSGYQWSKLISRFPLAWFCVETARLREVSLFKLFMGNAYICDALGPSIHSGLSRWDVGGKGGLSSGSYWFSPYTWRKYGIPTWELKGDNRRGAILLHWGTTINDSNGCFLLGNARTPDRLRLADSRLSTAIVWTLIRLYCDPSGQPGPSNLFVLIRNDESWGR